MPTAPPPSPRKALVTAFYQEMWNKADISLVARLMHTDVTFRGSLGIEVTGIAAVADYVRATTAALAGFTCDILHMIEEGDRIAARLAFHGRHRGVLLGFAPTGEPLEWAGSAHIAFRDALIADVWVLGDLHGLIRQLQRHAGGIKR